MLCWTRSPITNSSTSSKAVSSPSSRFPSARRTSHTKRNTIAARSTMSMVISRRASQVVNDVCARVRPEPSSTATRPDRPKCRPCWTAMSTVTTKVSFGAGRTATGRCGSWGLGVGLRIDAVLLKSASSRWRRRARRRRRSPHRDALSISTGRRARLVRLRIGHVEGDAAGLRTCADRPRAHAEEPEEAGHDDDRGRPRTRVATRSAFPRRRIGGQVGRVGGSAPGVSTAPRTPFRFVGNARLALVRCRPPHPGPCITAAKAAGNGRPAIQRS